MKGHLRLSHHLVDFDFAIQVHVAHHGDYGELLSDFYKNKFHKGKRYTGTCKRVFLFMKARQFLNRKKMFFDSMHVIGYHGLGAGRFKTTCRGGGHDVLWPEYGFPSSNAVFSNQTFYTTYSY